MKCIIVPVDAIAVENFEIGAARDGEVIFVYLDEKNYSELWDCGILEEINARLNLMIDYSEDEDVLGRDNLESLLSIVNSYLARHPCSAVLQTLRSITQCAIRFNTYVCFSL